ncbi:MAG TPA: hypothetical protein VIT44_17200 [Cyclobacteriaceae bacterium]
MKWILCLLACYSVAHISDASTCSTVDDQLLWACVITGYEANPHYPGHGHYQLKIVKVSYWQHGEQVWQHDAPDRIKNIRGVFMMGTDGQYSTGDTVRNIGLGTHPSYLIDFYMCPVGFMEKEIAVSYSGGLLVLERENGNVLIDHPHAFHRSVYFIPETEIVIRTGNKTCFFQSNCQSGIFTASCNSRLFHGDGKNLYVFDTTYKLVKTIKGAETFTDNKRTLITKFKGKALNVTLTGGIRELVVEH